MVSEKKDGLCHIIKKKGRSLKLQADTRLSIQYTGNQITRKDSLLSVEPALHGRDISLQHHLRLDMERRPGWINAQAATPKPGGPALNIFSFSLTY